MIDSLVCRCGVIVFVPTTNRTIRSTRITVEGKNNAGTNEARINRSWSEVVTGKSREKTTNNEEQEKESLF